MVEAIRSQNDGGHRRRMGAPEADWAECVHEYSYVPALNILFRPFHLWNFGFVDFINRFILNLPILQSNQCQKIDNVIRIALHM